MSDADTAGSPRTAVRTAVRTAAAGLAAGLAWTVGAEPRWYALRHATAPALPPGGASLRVLHLSDLHLLAGRVRRLGAFLDACRRAGPDLVVATGDLLGDPGVVDAAVDLLRRVRGDRPGLAVLGSGDLHGAVPKSPLDYVLHPDRRRFGPPMDTARLLAGLADAGWQVADNRRLAVATRAGVLDVAGLGDPHIGLDRPDAVDWEAPAPGLPALRLGVVHAPYLRALDVFDRHGFDLVLAGHTHGGQVRIPGVGALADNCDLPLGQARGLSRHGGTWLHVSAGLGQSRYAPYRLACRPEATILDVVPGPGPAGSGPAGSG